MSEGKATQPGEEHLVMTPAPSDHGSFASVDEAALAGRKKAFAEAMGGNERSTRPGPAPQDSPRVSRSQYYQHGICPPYLPPAHIPGTNPLRNWLPAMVQRPEPPQIQANPVTVSHATQDMLNMAVTRPPLSKDQFYPSEMWTPNRPPGFEHHKYQSTQQFIPARVTSDGTASIYPAYAASTYGGYDGSQLLQGFVPQGMPPYSLMQRTHGRPVHSHGGGYIAGAQLQESPAPARNNVGEGSLWLSTCGAPLWKGM